MDLAHTTVGLWSVQLLMQSAGREIQERVMQIIAEFLALEASLCSIKAFNMLDKANLH